MIEDFFFSFMRGKARISTEFPNEHRAFIHIGMTKILVCTYDSVDDYYLWTLNENIITAEEANEILKAVA